MEDNNAAAAGCGCLLFLALAVYVLPVLIVSIVGILVICYFIALIGFLISNSKAKKLTNALKLVKILIRIASSIVTEQAQFFNGKSGVFEEAKSRSLSILSNTSNLVELTELKYKKEDADLVGCINEINVAINCNSTCKLEEARQRKASLTLQSNKLKNWQTRLEQNREEHKKGLDSLAKHDSSISRIFNKFSENKRKTLSFQSELQFLDGKWSADLETMDSQIFRDLNPDIERVIKIVEQVKLLQIELERLDCSLASLGSMEYRMQEEDLATLKREIERLQKSLRVPDRQAGGYFGGRNIEWGEWPRHVAIAGASRAGKSLTIEMLMHPILLAIRDAYRVNEPRKPIRAVIFDVDGTTIAQLDRMGFQQGEYIILNPYDARRWGWATGKDIVSHDDILSLAATLLPTEKTSQSDPHWVELGRQVLIAVMDHLACDGTDWTLWDVFKIVSYDMQKLGLILDQNPPLERAIFLNASSVKHGESVFSTIRSRLGEIEVMAALWQQTSNKVSIREFLNRSGVLIIPEHGVKAKEALRKINSFVLQMIGMFGIDEGVLSPDQQPNTWIVVDEATRIAPIPRFDDFLTNGLKRGISVVFGFQSYPKAKEAFGEHDFEAILEQCTMTALLRLDGKSAEWASEKSRTYWGSITSITLGKNTQQGTSTQCTTGTSTQESTGGSRQYTEGTSTQTSHGGSTQTSHGGSTQTSSGSSRQRSEGVDSKGENWSTSTGDNWSTTTGENWSTTTGENRSTTTGENWGTATGHQSSDTTGENSSTSESYSIQISPQRLRRIESEDFAHFPETTSETGLTGVFLMRDLKSKAQVFASKLTIEPELIKNALIPESVVEQAAQVYRVSPEYLRQLLKRLTKSS